MSLLKTIKTYAITLCFAASLLPVHADVVTDMENCPVVDNIHVMLNTLPAEVKSYIELNGIDIAVVPEKEFLAQDEDVKENYVGFTYGDNITYMNGEWYDPLESAEAVMHEIGHILDCHNGMHAFFYSGTDEFKKVFEQYQSRLVWLRFRTVPNVQEAFAEGFMHYVLSPRMLRTVCPDMYKYYQSIFPIQDEIHEDIQLSFMIRNTCIFISFVLAMMMVSRGVERILSFHDKKKNSL